MTALIQKKKVELKTLFSDNDVKFSIINSFANWSKSFFLWWYVSMPVWYILSLKRILTIIDDKFSVTLLLKNFFTPWHKKNNIFNYIFGIFIKIIFLPIGISLIVLTSIIYISYIIIWLLIPPITIAAIFISPFIDLT